MIMHPYVAIFLAALAATIGSCILCAVAVASPPREPGTHDLRWVIAIITALALGSALASILLAVDL